MNDNGSVWSPGERQLFEELIIPSPHSVELERTTMSDFLRRICATSHVAELYHENSKLVPSSTLTVPEDDRKLHEAREWFFTTAYALEEDVVEPGEAHHIRIGLADLPEGLRSLLRPFTEPGTASDLLYSVDLLVLHGGRLYRLVVRTEHLWVERSISAPEMEALREAVLDLSDLTLARAEALLFLVACPWRYMLLYGPRGYRHTLLDAGRLLGHLETAARRSHLPLAVAQNFYDARIDRLLLADGVERSTLAILALSGGGPS
ncbi:MAG TPA: hypothetical protein VE685_18620 [Thermoanaerobaculia bacterium]|nr:hypothetical protein [Thermoanaerobaculia bacterium]